MTSMEVETIVDLTPLLPRRWPNDFIELTSLLLLKQTFVAPVRKLQQRRLVLKVEDPRSILLVSRQWWSS